MKKNEMYLWMIFFRTIFRIILFGKLRSKVTMVSKNKFELFKQEAATSGNSLF